MKSILLYVDDDAGMDARLRAALDVTRAMGGHLECAMIETPAPMMLPDPLGTNMVMPAVMDNLDARTAAMRARMTERLGREDVRWTLVEATGEPATALVARTRLADLVVLSLGSRHDGNGDDTPIRLVGDVATATYAPVLAVPADAPQFTLAGRAVVCWNGSRESADALRAATPLLAHAGDVHVLTIGEDNDDCSAEDAAAYLSRHGIGATVHHETRGDRTVPYALSDAIERIGADWIVMGAYGSGRLREWLFGGVTRDFLARSAVPIVLTH